MPRLYVPYDPGGGPSLELVLRAELAPGQWGPLHKLDAIVDSGATNSSLQEADADALGVTPALRTPAGTVTFANGAQAALTKPAVAVAARVVDPATNQYWGPTFRLTPSFKPAGDRLLGTRDFFETFEVSFWPHPAGSRFSLVI